MKNWEIALNAFLKDWESRQDVVGALVCGSYVTGEPTEHSDIDVHIILSNEEKWRKRGNKIVNGFLIEYFVNAPNQITQYFEEDYHMRRPHAMVQFITGRVIFDKTGDITRLKVLAKQWHTKEYPDHSPVQIDLMKYHLWDVCDNLWNSFKTTPEAFDFNYYNALKEVFGMYGDYLKLDKVPYDQIFNYLTKPNYLNKYLMPSHPDPVFCQNFLNCIRVTEREEKMQAFNLLTQEVLKKMGGFEIDSWSI